MLAKTSDTRAAQAFSLYALPMSIVGLWPLENDTPFRRLRISFFIFQIVFAVVTSTIRIISNCGNASDTMDTLIILSSGTVACIKILCLNGMRKKLYIVIYSAYKDWTSVTDHNDLVIMKQQLKVVKIVAAIFYGSGLPCAIIYVLKSFMFNDFESTGDNINLNETVNPTIIRHYPLPGGCAFSEMSDFTYYFIVICQLIQMTSICTVNMCSDIMYIATLAHVCGQIEILSTRLQRYGEKPEILENIINLDVTIKRHQYLMKLVALLEDVYNIVIFIQMLLSILYINFGGFSVLISIRNGDKVALIKDTGVIQFMLTQSYIYTFPADNLANQGEILLNSMYNSLWYQMPANMNKIVIYMMMRMNFPPYLTAGKFFYLTRASFMTVLKTGFSYLSVFRLMIQ